MSPLPPAAPPVPPATPAYLPASGCEAELNEWCHSPASECSFNALVARMHGGTWRCCSQSTLSADGLHFVSGSDYCSRHEPLVEVLRVCMLTLPAPPPTLPSPPAPPPSIPSPPRPPFLLVETLNRRFREGRPSNTIEEAGVLVSILDGDEDREHPWKRPFSTRDHISSSLVNARHPDCYWHLFNPGFVISSDQVQNRLRCSYAWDEGTYKVGGSSGCAYWTAFPPEELKQMMEKQDQQPWGPRHCQPAQAGGRERCGYKAFGYNEVVLMNEESDPWDNELPAAIEAIFVQARSGPDMVDYARRFHDGFYAAYPGVQDVPLLHYNWEDPKEPFTIFKP